MKKVLVLPGWVRKLRVYGNPADFYFQRGEVGAAAESADVVIGLSLGALVILREAEHLKGKIILVNPPLPKRGFLNWAVNWLKYVKSEGLFLERQTFSKNPLRGGLEILRCIKLLSIDSEESLNRIPKERLTVIRGKNDKFICDELAAKYLRAKGIKLIEVDSGHNWSESIERCL